MANNRVVIDTNVFISALIGQYSYPYKIFAELVLPGEVQLCLSSAILAEYETVSQRPKFARFSGFAERAKQLLEQIQVLADAVEPTETLTLIKDEPDNRLLEAAFAANAEAVVTGNSNDFVHPSYGIIKIYSPKEFYELHTAT